MRLEGACFTVMGMAGLSEIWLESSSEHSAHGFTPRTLCNKSGTPVPAHAGAVPLLVRGKDSLARSCKTLLYQWGLVGARGEFLSAGPSLTNPKPQTRNPKP